MFKVLVILALATLATATTCSDYCDKMGANCASTFQSHGANNNTACLSFCGKLPAGTAGATSGNSAECRLTKATASLCTDASPISSVCGSVCDGYCNVTVSTCTAVAGTAVAVWAGGYEQCADYCAKAINYGGHSIVYGGTSGDSLACRTYHGIVASLYTTADALHFAHCGHASALGDAPASPATLNLTTGGVCGSACEAYCDVIQAACGASGANSQFADRTSCMTACNGYSTAGFSATALVTTGANYWCRLYHAGVASTTTANAGIHCPHAGAVPTAACVAPAGSSTGLSGATSVAPTLAVFAAAAIALLAL